MVQPATSFPTDHSKAVPLLQFFFICAPVISYMMFVLSLFVPHPFFFRCPGKAVLCGCGIFWVSSFFNP